MDEKELIITLHGKSIELCIGIIKSEQEKRLDTFCRQSNLSSEKAWYENREAMKTIMNVENWWSVNQIDHAVGFLFSDKDDIKTALATLNITVDGNPVKSSPNQILTGFYLPEKIDSTGKDQRIVVHGALRTGHLTLRATPEKEFDPSLLQLNFLYYEDYGYILIDMDYDGFDEVEYHFSGESFLELEFM